MTMNEQKLSARIKKEKYLKNKIIIIIIIIIKIYNSIPKYLTELEQY
jgi:hypothetical protein